MVLPTIIKGVQVLDRGLKKSGPYVVQGAKRYFKKKIVDLIEDEFAKSKKKKREELNAVEQEKVESFLEGNQQIDKLQEKYQRTLMSHIDYDSIFQHDVNSLRYELREEMRGQNLIV